MTHRNKNKKLNRDSKARKALFKALVRSLIEEGSIVTTEAKAKEVRRIADKIIYRAKTDSIASRRLLHRFFGRRDVVNTLVEQVAPALSDRSSGFTTLKRDGLRRGDNSLMCRLSLINLPANVGSLKKPKATTAAPASAAPKKTKKVVESSVVTK